MKKFLKKMLYLGVDLSAQSVDKIEETIKELVDNNKVSVEKGERIVAKIMRKTEKQADYLESKIDEVIKKVSKKAKKKGMKNILTDEELKDTLKIKESK